MTMVEVFVVLVILSILNARLHPADRPGIPEFAR